MFKNLFATKCSWCGKEIKFFDPNKKRLEGELYCSNKCAFEVIEKLAKIQRIADGDEIKINIDNK